MVDEKRREDYGSEREGERFFEKVGYKERLYRTKSSSKRSKEQEDLS